MTFVPDDQGTIEVKREPLRALVQTDFEIGDNIKVVLKTHA